VTDINENTVRQFLDLAFNGKRPAEAAEKYVGPRYIQHNPQAADGRQAFVDFVTSFGAQFPTAVLEVKRVVAQADHVATHSLLKTSPEDRGMAVADFFRLENGKIVEHWDVLQPVPEATTSGRSMV
jgi:predicted SnoaL-like aldol condensation-catalyzing enzyme